ncbi:MAG: citryl-CoA lyase [Woeseiaceae bacterium]|nr:citryl-CoA lyase [Woeseiaceae bacterium]
MSDKKEQRGTTAICGFDADTIKVRGKDLANELIGEVSFTDYLYLQATGRSPTATQSAIVDAVLVTIMEHGLVPSAIVTRLTHYGAPESFQGAVAAGLLGVGDRYAGTAGECGAVLERLVAVPETQREEAAVNEVRTYREIRRPLPGFGHPIHAEHDPRVPRLIAVAEKAGAEGSFIGAMRTLEKALNEVTGKNLVTNISAAIGAVLGEAGIPASLMRGIVLTARCAGLVGHLHEEMQNPAAHSMWEGAQDRVDYTG